MYQSVYYCYKTYEYFLRDDATGWSQFKYQPTYYERVPFEREGVLPVLTGGWALPTKKYDKTNSNLLEKDINKELVLLRDLYYKEEDVIPSWHNVLFLDIEIEIGGALTPEYIKKAPMPITAVALLDKTTKQKICFILDKSKEIKETGDKNKKIIPCSTERELIQKFLTKLEELDPTIIVGYNSAYFDIPYLYYRIKNTVSDNDALRLSPIKKISIQDWDEENPIRLGGVNHLDFMLLLKKYQMRQEPSYKLKDIANKYTDLSKIEYEGNLNQLFKEDINLFIDYNLRDVEILDALDEKLKYVELTILISHISNIPYDQIYKSTMMGEGSILKLLKRKGIVSPNKPTTHNPSLKEIKESYAGGYIKEPIPGLYFDLIDEDFTSLYPSINKSLNLGIETLVGRIKSDNRNYEQEFSLEKLKLKDPKETITIEKLNKNDYTTKTTETTIEKIISIIEENNYSVAASGCIFRTDVKSVCTEVLEKWFEKREHYRELKKQAGKNKDWVKYSLYDTFQQAFKILQNGALYGTYAINGFRYTDGHKICSAAITNSGQRLTQESIIFINGYINKELKTKDDHVVLSDTDSIYICLQKLLKSRFPELKDEEKNDKILEIAKELQQNLNSNLNNIAKNLFNISDKHYFQLKQEVIAKSIIITGKRRYAMLITNKEGVEILPDNKDAFDVKGLELYKSNMNPIFKKFGEVFIKNVLTGKSKYEIDNSIIEFNKTLKTIDPRLLGKPTGVSHLKKYIKKKPSSGEIFSTFETGSPFNSKAAIIYNDLLNFKGLDKKYESIIEGDKIFVINLKPNPYRIETMGVPNSKIPPELDKFIKEYIDVEEIFESLLLNKLKELYKDINWSFPLLNSHVSKFFQFN